MSDFVRSLRVRKKYSVTVRVDDLALMMDHIEDLELQQALPRILKIVKVDIMENIHEEIGFSFSANWDCFAIGDRVLEFANFKAYCKKVGKSDFHKNGDGFTDNNEGSEMVFLSNLRLLKDGFYTLSYSGTGVDFFEVISHTCNIDIKNKILSNKVPFKISYNQINSNVFIAIKDGDIYIKDFQKEYTFTKKQQ